MFKISNNPIGKLVPSSVVQQNVTVNKTFVASTFLSNDLVVGRLEAKRVVNTTSGLPLSSTTPQRISLGYQELGQNYGGGDFSQGVYWNSNELNVYDPSLTMVFTATDDFRGIGVKIQKIDSGPSPTNPGDILIEIREPNGTPIPYATQNTLSLNGALAYGNIEYLFQNVMLKGTKFIVYLKTEQSILPQFYDVRLVLLGIIL